MTCIARISIGFTKRAAHAWLYGWSTKPRCTMKTRQDEADQTFTRHEMNVGLVAVLHAAAVRNDGDHGRPVRRKHRLAANLNPVGPAAAGVRMGEGDRYATLGTLTLVKIAKALRFSVDLLLAGTDPDYDCMPKRGGADEIPVIAEGAPALRWHERWKATADIVQWVSRPGDLQDLAADTQQVSECLLRLQPRLQAQPLDVLSQRHDQRPTLEEWVPRPRALRSPGGLEVPSP